MKVNTENVIEKSSLSRRGFLGAAGLAALGAGTLSAAVLGGCAPQVTSGASVDGAVAADEGDLAATGTGTQGSPMARINPQDWEFTGNTIEDFAATTMFSPIQVGSLTLKNRLVKSAATSMVANEEQKTVAYHGRIAAGGARGGQLRYARTAR